MMIRYTEIVQGGFNLNIQKVIDLETMSVEEMAKLFGPQDQYLRLMEKECSVQCIARSHQITIVSKNETNIQRFQKVIESSLSFIRSNAEFNERDIYYILHLVDENKHDSLEGLVKNPIARNYSGKLIYPKTWGQKKFVDAMKKSELVFAIGPAGTGKTYLAVVYAVNCLKNQEVKKIVLTRPAVEAGENLGFLPGDLKEKVDPYLRPLYDSLHDMLGVEQTEKLMEKGLIEIAPLAYMRGRTLESAFVILDEAQNTLPSQMKMFLTRMGLYSKVVVTGDITQIDLRKDQPSGLVQAKQLLSSIEEIAFIELTNFDIVRHPLVQKILDKYNQKD